MYELQKTHSMLNKLEELNNSKFNSSEFISLHSDLQTSLDKIENSCLKVSKPSAAIVNPAAVLWPPYLRTICGYWSAILAIIERISTPSIERAEPFNSASEYLVDERAFS